METMPRDRWKNLHKETNRHGKTVWYVRLGKGPRIRIKAVYGTPEFGEAYKEAVSGDHPAMAGKPARGTLEWLWNLYRQVDAWTDLSLATRKQRENMMRPILAKSGKEPLSKITQNSIKKGRQNRAATPAQARHFVDTMRGMYKWALEAELVRTDPTQGVKAKKPKTKGFPVWTDDDIAAFERRWPVGTRERVMFDIFCYTGLRRGDAATLGKQHVRDGVIALDTEKTGTRVTIPVLPELQSTLDAGPTGDLAFIATVAGSPMTKESVGNAFRDACRAAGIGKSAHGLRKAAATRAANNGATVAQLEAIFGWEGGQMASLYTRSADRKALAAGAMDKLSRTKTETAIPSPSGVVRELERKTQ